MNLTTIATLIGEASVLVGIIVPVIINIRKISNGTKCQLQGNPVRVVKCGYNYDFTPVTVTDENGVTHTGYGSREFFARPQSEVPADQIFTLPGNDHEIA